PVGLRPERQDRHLPRRGGRRRDRGHDAWLMPIDLVIRYNVARGFEDEALALARRLFATFDEAVDSLALIPLGAGEDEDLALYLNGRLLRSRRESGRPPRVADVRTALGASEFDAGTIGIGGNQAGTGVRRRAASRDG